MTSSINNLTQCSNCDLCHNQKPLLDFHFKGTVFWVGLSAVKVSNVNEDAPLSINTNSGHLINAIEQSFIDVEFYKTNLVKCLPLKEGKIRYPSKKEMESCYSNLRLEIQTLRPQLIFLLGRQVASFVAEVNKYDKISKFNDDFDYQPFNIGQTVFIPVHHPSYILVFKRKRVEDYIKQITRIIGERSYAMSAISKTFVPLQQVRYQASYTDIS